MDFLNKFKININNKELLTQALTHSSYANENKTNSYERLEFLGDAVLELIISDYLFKKMNLAEGGLSKLRSKYVCEQALTKYADDIGLIPNVLLGHGQAKDLNDTIIADVFESVIAAIYLDQGLEVVKSLIYEIIIPYIESNYDFFSDYKSVLQELTQTSKNSLEYVVVHESGPAHDKYYEVEARINNIVYGFGAGKSKKEAEQQAAFDAIKKQAK